MGISLVGECGRLHINLPACLPAGGMAGSKFNPAALQHA